MLHDRSPIDSAKSIDRTDLHQGDQGDIGFRPMAVRRKNGQLIPPTPSRPTSISSPGLVNRMNSPQRPLSSDGKNYSQNRRDILWRLYMAYQMAKRHARDVWDFSVEISEFGDQGRHLLRELACERYILHQREIESNDPDAKRRFEPEGELVLSERSCFVITDEGISELNRLEASGTTPTLPPSLEIDGVHTPIIPITTLRPRWDEQQRKLFLGNELVKHFNWPAPNQELIIKAFEEQGWPERIDDPLPVNPDVNAKVRLHDTIKCLNRKRKCKKIKFCGDGTGQGIIFRIDPDA